MSKESRIVATERLRAEGRWDEASAYRDEVRRSLKAEKKSRAEANDDAWEAMLSKYPPLPAPDPPPRIAAVEQDVQYAADIDALLERIGETAPDMVRDTIWVYESLENARTMPTDAPSLGAWSLLKWARENRNRFFEQLLPKAMSARQTMTAEPEEVEDPGIVDVERILKNFVASWEAGLIADVPGTVKADVQSTVADWERRNKAKISSGALENLQLHIIHLVDRCIVAALKNPQAFQRYADAPS